MRYPKTLSAFSKDEYVKAHALLASRVTTMMGRKFEEGDWSYVYHTAKNIPVSGWSNLNIDVIYQSLGVEHKMLCVRSKKEIREYCGTTLMHPAATRSIRIPSTEGDPTEAARDVLNQYAELIEQRRENVAENSPNEPDMRIGWLLWQESLQEFLYFEEEMLKPNPDDYWAEWRESGGGGTRKASKNLWVYEAETGKKRYSITTTAGAKIQPYFDVPPPNNPNLYYFRVQGEEIGNNLIRIWVTPTTALILENLFGELDTEKLSSEIVNLAQEISEADEDTNIKGSKFDLAKSILVTKDAYLALTQAFSGVSDEHMMQLFARYVAQR